MTEWFEQWFGEEYHVLYPHRDEEEARRAVALVQRVAPWESGERVLDLACGAGRHAAELERLGARVVGFDLSPSMLRRARARIRGPLVRGDMRALPFRPGSFGLAVNLFTSFGYFRDDGENHHVVRQVAEALRSGGRFVLDYLNADHVRRTLRRDTEEVDGAPTEVRVRRRFSEEGRYVVKEIELGAENRSFQERVRLYSAAELEGLLVEAGLRVRAAFGDYDGGPLDDRATRTILVGTRT
ncbi:MAG TPA: class I SAM-dependent methyltransferase [Gemmatimonadales bacterium]|jgi:SAM-dependent methyltransferase|nr:class I SAM-dependent methyltransferase [Gemmatimonadales bacterium]